MALGGQADEGTAHGNHVVVRVRGEDEDGLRERQGRYRARAVFGLGALLAAGPAGDGVLEVVEDVDVDLVIGAELLEEFAEGVLQIVLFRELQDRLSDGLAQPHDRFALELGRPVAGTDEPGGDHAGEVAARGLIDKEVDVVVALQQGSRAASGHLAFGDGLHGGGLVLAPGHQDDASGGEHRTDAHGDGAFRRGVDVVVEVPGLTLAGLIGEAHGAGAGLFVAAGLVEADLAFFAHADYEKVQVAGLLVELGAVAGDELLRDGSVGDVDVLFLDIDLVQQGLVKPVIAALERVGGGRIVFVDGDDFHVLERDLAGLVAAGEFIVQGRGGGAGREAEAEQTPFRIGFDGVDDQIGDSIRSGAGLRVDLRPDFFIIVKDALGKIFFDQASFVR